MEETRLLDDLVILNDNVVFKHAFVNAFQTLRATDACATLVWRGLFDDAGTSWYLTNLSIQAVPELPDVLTADSPPPFSWFMSLPPVFDQKKAFLKEHVLVYAVCMQKQGAEDKIYFGSAFGVVNGCYDRIVVYRNNTRTGMSMHMTDALDAGYRIVHMGTIFLLRLPYEERTPFAHSCILGLEAWSTYHFWGLYRGVGPRAVGENHYLRHLCPWSIDNMLYGGLCSHSALMDPVTIGPPGLYEGYETMQRLLLEKEEAERRYEAKRLEHLELAKIMARAYANGETSDIVDKFNDEHVLEMIKLGAQILERDRKHKESPQGVAQRLAASVKQENDRKQGAELLQQVAAGTLIVDATADQSDKTVVATPEQVAFMRKAAAAQENERRKQRLLDEGRNLLSEIASGTLVRTYSERPVDPETGESMDVAVATQDDLSLISKLEDHRQKHNKASAKYRDKVRAGKQLLEDLAAGTLIRAVADRPIDPQTGDIMDIRVATTDEIDCMESAEKWKASNAKGNKKRVAKGQEGRKLLKDIAAGTLVKTAADRPVDPLTGIVKDVAIATPEQLNWMDIAIDQDERHRVGKQKAKAARHAKKAAAAGKENVDPMDEVVDSDAEMID